MNKNSQSFKEFYSTINFKFTIVCFSETWVDDISFSKVRIFNFHVTRSYIKQQKNRKGTEVCIFVHENLSSKLREDLGINCDAIQSLSIQISSTKSKNIILNTIYRPPNFLDFETTKNV